MANSLWITNLVIFFCLDFNCFCFLRTLYKLLDSINKLKSRSVWKIRNNTRKIITKNLYSRRLRLVKWKLLKITNSNSCFDSLETSDLSRYLGGFNISKISKSVLEFYFLRFCLINDWSLCCPTILNKHFPWNETKRVISNANYLGCPDRKLHKRCGQLCQFLSLSQTRPEKNINHNPSRIGDCSFRSSLIYKNKSKHTAYFRFYYFPDFLLIWYRTNFLDSYFWNDSRINNWSRSVKLVNLYNSRYHNYSHAYSSRGFISLLYFLWISQLDWIFIHDILSKRHNLRRRRLRQ